MQTDEENVHKKKDNSDALIDTVSPKQEKLEILKKSDKKTSVDDPKPRIVLTFRSDKSGTKNSNMKIVSTEEKHEDVAPRRSNRARHSKWESDDENDTLVLPKKDISVSQSENDDVSDNSHTSKRSTRRRCPDVLTSALERKEKSYNETKMPTQRLSRRIKPTAKILANEELRIGLESQNNARLGIATDKSMQQGVRTRRWPTQNTSNNNTPNTSRRSVEEEISDKKTDNSVKKLRHLCELGLKAINKEKAEQTEDSESINDNGDEDNEDEAEEDEEIDDDIEVISKLLEADEESGSTVSDDASIDSEVEEVRKRRQSRRLSSSNESNGSVQDDGGQKTPPRRSKRLKRFYNVPLVHYTPGFYQDDSNDAEYIPKTKKRRSISEKNVQSDEEEEEKMSPADGDGNMSPASPNDSSKILATCNCEEPSNIYAAPSELTEPVFCQAIESAGDARLGCSHSAARIDDSLQPLMRAGPRAPYVLLCRQHTAQLRAHMCCPTCGLFCSQGTFFQCSKGHLFHLECMLPRQQQVYENKLKTGCPHCGIRPYLWSPVNTDCHQVKVEMHCSNKQVFLPEQREQCTPAFLGFSSLDPTKLDLGPLIPEDLLPSPPIDLKKLCEVPKDAEDGVDSVRILYEAIVAGETVEELIPKIIRGERVNQLIEGGTCAHAAAAHGRPAAMYLLHYAGAHLDALDSASRTPLMRAITALLDREVAEEAEVEVEHTEDSDIKVKVKSESKEDVKPADDKPSDDDYIKVIKYLVAAGCDVNIAGSEGMTALHIAAQFGSVEVSAILLHVGGARPDARDRGGWTPLVRAAENGHAEVVQLLLAAGADAAVTDAEGHCAVHWCALAGRARTLGLLLAAAPHAVAAPNAHADTPLHIAAREGHYACVVMLLARGARVDLENSAGELPVEVCSGECQTAITLNMQMALAVRGSLPRLKLISSDISNGREEHPVPCVNEEDDATPDDFVYVAQLVTPAPLAIDNTIQTMQGCACAEGECDSSACACCTLGVRRWYVDGRLPANFPYHDPPMLFECNPTCACNMRRCGNSVVSRATAGGSLGAGVRAQVFRTRTRGWGLRARERVRRGALVALYCGELLAAAAADARASDHYMFALDLKPDLLEQCSDQTQLCIDAAKYGSAARFINHSCRPNLAPVRVFTSTRDLRLPTVALFAVRDIPACEELTFDYGDKFWSVKSKWMRCECEAPDCRYPTKTVEEAESN